MALIIVVIVVICRHTTLPIIDRLFYACQRMVRRKSECFWPVTTGCWRDEELARLMREQGVASARFGYCCVITYDKFTYINSLVMSHCLIEAARQVSEMTADSRLFPPGEVRKRKSITA